MTETILIDGMHCGGCVASVRRAIERLPIRKLDVTIGSVTIDYDESTTSHEQIVDAIVDAGYTITAPAA